MRLKLTTHAGKEFVGEGINVLQAMADLESTIVSECGTFLTDDVSIEWGVLFDNLNALDPYERNDPPSEEENFTITVEE